MSTLRPAPDNLPTRDPARRQLRLERAGVDAEPTRTSTGMILLDSSFSAIALDEGAARLLAGPERSDARPGDSFALPVELQNTLRRCKPSDLPSLRLNFRLDSGEYACRISLLETTHDSLPRHLVAVHLERGNSTYDILTGASAEYHLTDREEETLRGIAIGLTSKELAERMNISPNTVKAFVRMIMAKMGVSTRSGIVAKLLEHNGR